MNLSGTFFSKVSVHNKLAQSQAEHRPTRPFCCFHDLVVCPLPYTGRHSLPRLALTDESLVFTNPKTSLYLCKRHEAGFDFDRAPTLVMKRLAYRSSNKRNQRGETVYNDSESKNYDQVSTEFHCYEMLRGSPRAVQLRGLLHENVRSREDTKFFYQSLRLPDRRSKDIRNVAFLLEEMNQGSLREQLEDIAAKRRPPFSEEQVIERTCQMVEGLLELRARGIVHRDLRPDNILFHEGQLKFSDFDSAFIRGYSDGRNIKNGVDMKETTPLEIMLLISESEERLGEMGGEELFDRQAKADIYFLGVNIYSMVFSQPFETFNGGKVLHNLTKMQKRKGFCPPLLDLMTQCLEKVAHIRIGLDQVVRVLAGIEREAYLNSPTYKRVYLSPEPLNLYSFSSSQMDHQAQALPAPPSNQLQTREELEKRVAEKIRSATLERHTARHEPHLRRLLKDRTLDDLWSNNRGQEGAQLARGNLMRQVEAFLEHMQVKAYYYEFAFRILSEVDLESVAPGPHRASIKAHLELLSSELVVLLTFLYDTILKGSFTSDPDHDPHHPSYETRRVAQDTRKLHSRREFFRGRKKLTSNAEHDLKQLQEKLEAVRKWEEDAEGLGQIEEGVKVLRSCVEKVRALERLIGRFRSVRYEKEEERVSFWQEHSQLVVTLGHMERIVGEEMSQTIVNLILAYDRIKAEAWSAGSNLKNAVFMLMILESQDTNAVHKHDLVIIKEELTSIIGLGLGWKSEELEAFFSNYTQVHAEEVAKGLHELSSQVLLQSSKTLTQKHFTSNLKSLKRVVGELGEEREGGSARSLRDIAIKITQPCRDEASSELEEEPEGPTVRIVEAHTPPSQSEGEPEAAGGQRKGERGEREEYVGLRESVVVEELADEEDLP